MPASDVNLMWIGNRALLDSSPTNNITKKQADEIRGWTAEGKDQIAAVSVTGTSYGSGSGSHFNTSYQGSVPQPASKMTYTNPAGQPQTGVKINTFVDAQFKITVHDQDGNASVVQKSGILMQMSNGDLFFRPSVSSVGTWSGIGRISKVEIATVKPIENSTPPSTIGFKADIFETEIVCFVRGTLIECADGLRPVESLRVGDLVRTVDNGFKPLRWIASQRIAENGTVPPKLRPIRIRAGALAPNVPSSDLLVSPQHRILVRSNIATRLFGAAEVLVAARQLLILDGVDVAQDLDRVEYFHFAFDQHEVVYSNGAETESLYPGPQALMSIGHGAREELFTLFPELRDQAHGPVAARTMISGREGRKLASRHAQHARALVAPVSLMH